MSSALSLLMALAVVGVLIALASRRNTGAGGGKSRSYTTLGYAFSWTFGTALFLVSGLTGYRLDNRERFFSDARWSDDYLWNQMWVGLVMACVAAWFWRKGLREIRSNVHVPELAGRDTAAPPSRRLER